MTYEGKLYHRERYKDIIAEQVMLGYLTKGGVSYDDSEKMTPYERKLALDTIRKFIDDTNKAQEEKIKNLQMSSKNSGPKTLTKK